MNKTYALLIGINNYHPKSGVSSLAGCANDVNNMKSFLENKFSTDALHIKTLLNEEATYRNIIDHFGAEHLLKAEKGDTVLVHYSGHGAREKAAPEFKPYFPEEKQETIVCYDSRLKKGFDLADKELGVLVERIAEKGTNVVLILDCCHAGSGSKNVSDIQLGESRQWDDSDKIRPLETYLDGHFLEKVYIPNSKHILIAACKKNEKAFELHSNQGNLSSHLLQVLKESKGDISYANLFAQTRILMHRISDSQNPQFETSGFFNGHSSFLGTGTDNNETTYQIFENQDGQWQVDAGAIHGLPSTPDKAAQFEVFLDGKPIALVETTSVNVNHSIILPTRNIKSGNIYQAKLMSLPIPPIPVALIAEGTLLKSAKKNARRFNPIYFELLENAPNAPYQLRVEEHDLQIIRTADNKMIRKMQNSDEVGFKDIFKHIEKICKWEKTLTLQNEQTPNRKDVELVLIEMDSNRNVLRENKNPEVIIDILKQNGKEQIVPFRLEARNHSSENWHCALIYFSGSYRIKKYYNEVIPANSSVIMLEYLPSGKPFAFALNGKNESIDIFKLIASKVKISDYLLEQEGIKIGDIQSTPRDIGDEDEVDFNLASMNEWFTFTMKCNCVAQQASVGEKDILLANRSVKILANNSGFKANIAMTSATGGTRSLSNSMSILSKLVADSDASIVNFGNATRSLSAPNVLVLQDIQNEDNLQENPLQIEIDAKLKADESLMPFTFDGEHIIPVGLVETAANGKAIVSIDHIPDIQEERRRSITKAIKLCFMKLALNSKNIQQLCWADYDLPEVERRTEGLYTKVQDAEKILLCIHGIIGDSKIIAECMRKAYEEGTYDLILTFDYENLNTPIQETANVLDEKLKEVGIDSTSDKKITILAHSMGGLVSRYYIEKLSGNEVVNHLVMAGTPNAGSAIAKVTQYRNVATTLIGLAMNTTLGIPALGTLLAVLNQSKKVTPTLEQMDGDNEFLQTLNKGNNPNVPYSIVAGHLKDHLEKNAASKSLMDKLYNLGAKVFYGEQSNDIAVSVNSILSISKKWNPTKKEVACHHLNYFVEEESVKEIYQILKERTPMSKLRDIGDEFEEEQNESSSKPKNNYLLIIGINAYSNGISTLNNAVLDAKAFEEVMQSKYGIKKTIALYDNDATREGIITAFDKLLEELTKDDNLIIYFSGHGELIRNRGYWIPVDAENGERHTYLSNHYVRDLLNDIAAHHVLVIVDACFSGALLLKERSSAAASRYYQMPSRWVMTSGQLKPVPDGAPGEHSPFAKSLITQLEYNPKDYLSISELWLNMREGVIANSDQTPACEPVRDANHQGGEYYFIDNKVDGLPPIPDTAAIDTGADKTLKPSPEIKAVSNNPISSEINNSKNIIAGNNTINVGGNLIIGDNNAVNSNLEKEDLDLGPGNLLYHIPKEMEIDKVFICKVRIAQNRKILLEDIQETASSIIKDITKITKVMFVELIDISGGKSFNIVEGSSEEQRIENEYYTEWLFYVTPIKAGIHNLQLRLSNIKLVNGKERKKDLIFLEEVNVATINETNGDSNESQLEDTKKDPLADLKKIRD